MPRGASATAATGCTGWAESRAAFGAGTSVSGGWGTRAGDVWECGGKLPSVGVKVTAIDVKTRIAHQVVSSKHVLGYLGADSIRPTSSSETLAFRMRYALLSNTPYSKTIQATIKLDT